MTSRSNFGRDPSQFSNSAFTAGAAVGVGILSSAVGACFQRALEHRNKMSEVEQLQALLDVESNFRNYHVDRADRAEARAEAAEKCSRALFVENARLQREIKVDRALRHMCR